MNAHERCPEWFEELVALAMGELDLAAERHLRNHLAGCAGCRAAFEALVEEEKQVRTGFDSLACLVPVERSVIDVDHHPDRTGISSSLILERGKEMVLAHRRLIVAAAAAASLAVGIILYVGMFSFSAPAYALEQTVEANSLVRSYHAKLTPAAELGEVWVEMDAEGNPIRARCDFQAPMDGAKVVVLSEGKAEIWFKNKNSHVFVPEKDGLQMVMQLRSVFDPKLAFDQLQAGIKAGKVHVDTQEPRGTGEPITLTISAKNNANEREVYQIAPTTKLVERITHYRRRGEEWKQLGCIEFLDYNKPIDPAVFRLDLPDDVITVDQINRIPGLVRGDLSEAEIAKRVVREFFEALIAQDYDKAGLIYEGMPAQNMKEMFGRFKFHRIVELGEPVAGQHPDRRALKVPVKVEWETPGGREVKEFSPYVRAPHNQPDRRGICGGV